jgi:acetyl-CoA carboxylase biotin carboxyl carrier protein
MDIKDLKSLIKMVTETDITEFEMEGAEEKIRIKRGGAPEVVHYAAPQQVFHTPTYSAPHAPAAAPSLPQLSAAAAAPSETPDKGQAITSPIVGTFYRAPSPDAAPYAQEGQVVEKGQVLCIIEAMKLMNEIEAEFRCKILKVCKENAQPVEFGENLFIVEPM